MKKLLLLLLAFPIAVGCERTTEEKIDDLASKFFKPSNDSIKYKSISCKIDTLFNSVLFAPGVKDTIYAYIKNCDKINKLKWKKDSLKYQYICINDKDLEEKIINESADYGIAIDSIQSCSDNISKYIQQISDSIDVTKQYGWIVKHKYSYTFGEGKPLTDECIFITDINAKEVLWNTTFWDFEIKGLLEETGNALLLMKNSWEDDGLDEFHALGI